MRRFFVRMAYDGTDFHGWQRQPHSASVQQAVEEAIALLYRQNHSIFGCGRTDTGVHASCFYFHVDLPEMSEKHIFKLNAILPRSVVLYQFYEVDESAHARFDATKRSYQYFAHGFDTPFLNLYSSRIVELKRLTVDKLNETASILTDYKDFTPFCKKHADNKTNKCQLSHCSWTYIPDNCQFVLDITSDRFLRGMVRLIVGTCVLVAKGDVALDEVKEALESHSNLSKNLSAPPQGLFLNQIEYPYIPKA